MESVDGRARYSCTGGPPWPPLIGREQHLKRGAATEDRPYRTVLLVAVFVLVWMLLTCCHSVFALNPALDINQYAHTSWKIRDGFTKGTILTIAQTPDGYLW